jgi:hypothetical protein
VAEQITTARLRDLRYSFRDTHRLRQTAARVELDFATQSGEHGIFVTGLISVQWARSPEPEQKACAHLAEARWAQGERREGQKAVAKRCAAGDCCAGFSAARRAPPVRGRPPVGANIPMVNVEPLGAEAIGTTGKALPPGRTEVEM